MKVTKDGDMINILNNNKKRANEECEKCPNCGIKSKFHGGVCKQWAEGLFKTKYYKIDCYSCEECGCQWESDKYEYN